MPCYNQGQYIDESVDSVLKQTFQSFEIIIINDGSTDPFTIEHLKHFHIPKTRVIHTDNKGVAAARNRGIQEASGRYILPLDADDCITPIYLEKAVAILDSQPDVGIVYGQAELFGEQTGFWNLPDYRFPDILLGNVIFNSAVFRKADWETVGGYRSNMIYNYEDYDFWLYLIELGRKIIRLPDIVYYYRQLPHSRDHSMQFDQRIESYAQLFHNHPKLYTENIDVLFRAYLTCQANEHQYSVQTVHLTGELHQTQAYLHQTQADLHQTQAELGTIQTQLHQTQVQLQQSQMDLETAQVMISAMESSKFWKLRQIWMHFKRFLSKR
jgi:glycosyltransferase involved in cell wall biosynthesis